MVKQGESGKTGAVFERFRKARRGRGLRQTEVARQIGARQSAISMFEGGRADALAEDKILQYAGLLDLDISPEELNRARGRVGGRTCLKFCPQPECATNVPLVVGGVLILRPNLVEAPLGHAAVCRVCGEILEEGCPHCGADLADQPNCASCGESLVDASQVGSGDAYGWAAAQRATNREILELMNFVKSSRDRG